MQENKHTLNIEQRAFVVGEEGVCPICGREVEWDEVDPSWYVCVSCMVSFNEHEDESSNSRRTLSPPAYHKDEYDGPFHDPNPADCMGDPEPC